MKRLFPRAVPAALSLLGFFGFVSLNEGCTPQNNVKPGAPVLMAMTIVENGSTNTTITPDLTSCPKTYKSGDACLLVDVAADAGADGGLTGSANPMCQTTASDWCRCQGDPSMSPMGTWDCDPFAPQSIVYATFDRLLDTTPLDPGDAAVQARSDLAMLTALPAPPTGVTTSTSYTPMGDPSYFFFAGGPNGQGPTLTIQASPAMPTGTTVTLALDLTKILAKDGKTPFTGTGWLKDGTLKFNTAAFGAQIAVPTAPPPDASADAATDAAGVDGGADAVTEAGSEAGVDGATDAGADAATDAGTDGGVADASSAEVAAEAGASDAGTTSDATTTAPPTPGAPVPADMNMAPVTVTFNNTVDTTETKTDGGATNANAVQSHISVTEDGKVFTAFKFNVSKAPQLSITPTTAWAAGKTYVVTVDATAADVVGDTLMAPATATFMMAN